MVRVGVIDAPPRLWSKSIYWGSSTTPETYGSLASGLRPNRRTSARHPFATHEHPLALFLDDLQWLDAATIELLEHLITVPDVRHLCWWEPIATTK